MIRTILTLTALGLASPAFADGHATGDAAKGAKTFGKCKSCHKIVSDTGEEIVKGGRSAPNLYGIIGSTAATMDGFKYSKDLVAAGEAGLVWDEAQLAEYVADPRKFLRAYLDDSKAKSAMTYRLKKGGADVAAYLASVGPAPVTDDSADATTESSDS